MEKAAQDFGTTHGLDFARWITEIAEILKKSDPTDPTAQVCFLEIAKSLERLRRYKRDLTIGTFRDLLIVNETPITAFPIAEIVAAPLVRLMHAAGLDSFGISHKIAISNVEMLARILAHPEAPRPSPEAMPHVALNPVKYIVVFSDPAQETGPLAPTIPTPEEAGSASGDQLFGNDDVHGAVDDAFAGWSAEDDPLKAASREMARTLEQVMPSLEKLSSLDRAAPADFLRGYFEKHFARLTKGKSLEEFLVALGHVLKALPPAIQEHVFGKAFRKADPEDIVEAVRGTSAEFRTNVLLESMAGMSGLREIRRIAETLVGAGGEVQMVEHVARRLLAVDISPLERANLQKLLGVFGFDPSQTVRRRIVLYLGREDDEYRVVNRLLQKRGYGVILWDGVEGDRPPGQEMEPDIVIMDASAAGEHGHAFLTDIAAANHKTPIVVFSDGVVDVSPYYELGAGRVSVLQRPVPNDVLLSFFEEQRTNTRGMPAETPGMTIKDSTSKFLKADLARAREIQDRLVPRQIPDVPGADIAIAYRPCTEVGGDYLDLFWIAPGHLAFVIADVSGKGVAAAMVMVMVRSVFRTVSTGTRSPRETLLQVNRMLARDVKKGIFVSALYGIYDVENQKVTMANGGHNPPVVWRQASGTAEFFSEHGMALGLTERASFENSIRDVSTDLRVGDKILLYTDGVTEAFGPDGSMYGDERLHAVFQQHAKTPSHALVDTIMADIDAFIGRAPRTDDTTMLVLGRPPGALIDVLAP